MGGNSGMDAGRRNQLMQQISGWQFAGPNSGVTPSDTSFTRSQLPSIPGQLGTDVANRFSNMTAQRGQPANPLAMLVQRYLTQMNGGRPDVQPQPHPLPPTRG